MGSLTAKAAWALPGAGLLLMAASLVACSSPSARTDAGVLGYGTPGVASYVPAEQSSSLQALRDRCGLVRRADAGSQTQGLPAAATSSSDTAQSARQQRAAGDQPVAGNIRRITPSRLTRA